MQVRLLFFGPMAEQLGTRERTMVLEAASSGSGVITVATLLRELKLPQPQWQFEKTFLVAVNQDFAGLTTALAENDEVAFLPPMSGGSQEADRVFVALTRTPLDRLALEQRVQSPRAGALVTFDGVVRDHSRMPGENGPTSTLYLDYDGYEAMALKLMRAIGEEALEMFSVHAIALAHRLGRLEIGESSVIVAVSSAHRAPAFEACRYAIDTLKTSVPIWKKEYFEGGAVWVEGELGKSLGAKES